MGIADRKRPATRQAHITAIERVIDAMRSSPDAALSLRDMARVAYMSPFHFVRTFRDVTGVRPRQFLRALRLETAKRRLVETPSSITDVCFDVGYSSLGTFIRSFTDLLGVSPRRLRSMAREGAVALSSAVTHEPEPAAGDYTVGGRLSTPDGFAGPVFVGLFPAAIPQGRPAACGIAVNADTYRVSGVRDGSFYLFALGIPWSASAKELVLCDSAVRGGGQMLEMRDGHVAGMTDIQLRQPSSLDPPLVFTVPPILWRRAPLRAALTKDSSKAAS